MFVVSTNTQDALVGGIEQSASWGGKLQKTLHPSCISSTADAYLSLQPQMGFWVHMAIKELCLSLFDTPDRFNHRVLSPTTAKLWTDPLNERRLRTTMKQISCHISKSGDPPSICHEFRLMCLVWYAVSRVVAFTVLTARAEERWIFSCLESAACLILVFLLKWPVDRF